MNTTRTNTVADLLAQVDTATHRLQDAVEAVDTLNTAHQLITAAWYVEDELGARYPGFNSLQNIMYDSDGMRAVTTLATLQMLQMRPICSYLPPNGPWRNLNSTLLRRLRHSTSKHSSSAIGIIASGAYT